MMTEIFTSANGQRVLRECQETLDKPANGDEYSRRLVMQRYATELDIFEYELGDLLKRLADVEPEKGRPMPNDIGDTRPCPHCPNTQTLTRNASIAGSNYVISTNTERGIGEVVPKPALAWLCENREHYEVVQM